MAGMQRVSLFIATLACAISGVTLAQTRETQERSLQKYLKYAGDPVEEFPFWRLDHFELVGPDKVVIWPTIHDAYLVTVSPPCAKLEWAMAIGVTSEQRHVVSRKFDYVTTGNERCKIEQIRPIDYKTMRRDQQSGKS